MTPALGFALLLTLESPPVRATYDEIQTLPEGAAIGTEDDTPHDGEPETDGPGVAR